MTFYSIVCVYVCDFIKCVRVCVCVSVHTHGWVGRCGCTQGFAHVHIMCVRPRQEDVDPTPGISGVSERRPRMNEGRVNFLPLCIYIWMHLCTCVYMCGYTPAPMGKQNSEDSLGHPSLFPLCLTKGLVA